MIKQISILFLALATTFAAFGQSKTVESFEAEAEGYKLFMYQSVIRLLNKDKNPDFNLLIQDLDHLRFATTDSVGPEAMSTFRQLDEGVQQEGFEAIMTFDNEEMRCHLYEKESRSGKSSWVATLFTEGRAGVIEMKGSLNMKYINAFSSLNSDLLKEMMPGDLVEDMH